MKINANKLELLELQHEAARSPMKSIRVMNEVLDFAGEHFLDEQGNPKDIPKWNLWKWIRIAWALFALIRDIIKLLKK